MTVGAQIPFDRLTRAVDLWAGRAQRDDVVAQIGDSDYVAKHVKTVTRMPPAEFEAAMAAADLIVGHAGTGTILTAMSLGKPVLVLPRRADLEETRNDHQLATARRFAERGVMVAWDEEELMSMLDSMDEIAGLKVIGPWATPELIDRLRRFIADGS